MSHLQEITRRAAPMTDEESKALQSTGEHEKGIYEMQTEDIVRLVVYRRAVQAQHYNEGFEEDDAVYYTSLVHAG